MVNFMLPHLSSVRSIRIHTDGELRKQKLRHHISGPRMTALQLALNSSFTSSKEKTQVTNAFSFAIILFDSTNVNFF